MNILWFAFEFKFKSSKLLNLFKLYLNLHLIRNEKHNRSKYDVHIYSVFHLKPLQFYRLRVEYEAVWCVWDEHFASQK